MQPAVLGILSLSTVSLNPYVSVLSLVTSLIYAMPTNKSSHNSMQAQAVVLEALLRLSVIINISVEDSK